MNYRLIPFDNDPILSSYVYDLYEIVTYDYGCSYTTVPNGIIGISIDIQGLSEIFRIGQWNTIPQASIFGLIQRPHVIRVSSHFREIAVGFKPYFLQLLLAENMSHLTGGAATDAREIFDGDEIEILNHSLFNAKSDCQITVALSRFIAHHLQPEKADLRLLEATRLIAERKILRVESLAEHLNISSTTLRNNFKEKIGISPKDLIRLTRLREALRRSCNLDEGLTALSYDLGYFDQSHFIHDFKSLMQLSPSKYFSDERLIFDFYNYGRWRGDSFGLLNQKY